MIFRSGVHPPRVAFLVMLLALWCDCGGLLEPTRRLELLTCCSHNDSSGVQGHPTRFIFRMFPVILPTERSGQTEELNAQPDARGSAGLSTPVFRTTMRVPKHLVSERRGETPPFLLHRSTPYSLVVCI